MAKPQQRKGRAPDKPATPTTQDLITELVPDASPEVSAALGQLRSREPEIKRWLDEDPSRLDGLEQNPEGTLDELLTAIGVEWPGGTKLQKTPDLKFTLERPDEAGPPAVGSALLSAVWSVIGRSEQNAAVFVDDPFKVIRQVATDTGASNDERDVVIRAFEIIHGIERLAVDPFAGLPEPVAYPGLTKPVTVTRLTTG